MNAVGQDKWDIFRHNDPQVRMFLGIMAVPRHDWVPDGSWTDFDLNILVSGQPRVA